MKRHPGDAAGSVNKRQSRNANLKNIAKNFVSKVRGLFDFNLDGALVPA